LGWIAKGKAFRVAMHGTMMVAPIFARVAVALYPSWALLRSTAVSSIEVFVATLGVLKLLMML
jgi:hypothetical protein